MARLRGGNQLLKEMVLPELSKIKASSKREEDNLQRMSDSMNRFQADLEEYRSRRPVA